MPDIPNTLPDASSDVLVVGGGPAGSTIAALLAERGNQVVLVEKDRHPRFHIGESLLPLNLPLLERLGVMDEIERIGMIKYGAEFVSPYHNKSVTFNFANAWHKDLPYSYQVRRSEFDHILLKNAVAKGAAVVEGCRVTEIEFGSASGALIQARDDNGRSCSWRAKFLVDATGRDTLLATRLGIKHRNRKHSSAAIFGHFTGARRLPGKEAGNITVFWFDYGWFWFIPLADGMTSVGAVCRPQYIKSRKTDLVGFFKNAIELCPALADRLKDAQLATAVTATGNYSYRAERMIGKNYIMLGDAFAFIDPLFSAGVFLAMNSAFAGADVVSTCLSEPRKAKRALKRFDADIRRGVDTYSWYVYRISRPAFRHLFMAPRNLFRVEEAMLSLLSGDIFRPSPVRRRLIVFKILYYLISLSILKESLLAWRKHKREIRAALREAA